MYGMEPKRKRRLVPPITRAVKMTSTDLETGCWNWTGYISEAGYGQFWHDGRSGYRAHRFMYEHHVGPIPDGLDLDHLCRNRKCVNPEHLEPVTKRVNVLRGDGCTGLNFRKTHCKWGHEFTEENTIHVPKGRHCKACKRRRAAEWYAKKQAKKIAAREQDEPA